MEINLQPWPWFLASPVAGPRQLINLGCPGCLTLHLAAPPAPSPPAPPDSLSHSPENAFPCFAEAPHCSWQDGQSTGRTMRCPLLRMYVGHPRAGKCLLRGFLSQLPPHPPSPFPPAPQHDPGSLITPHSNSLQVTKTFVTHGRPQEVSKPTTGKCISLPKLASHPGLEEQSRGLGKSQPEGCVHCVHPIC